MNFLDFALSTGSSLLANGLTVIARSLSGAGLPTPLYFHKRELRTRLGEMPFIYRDLDADVLEDFVEVKLERVDPTKLTPAVPTKLLISLDKRLRNRKKVLLLGNAGARKTTFARHTILSIIAGEDQPFLFADERPV